MLIPAISFPGNCEEAITFYKEAIGAEVREVAYFKDAPPNSGMDESLPPNFVMHSEIAIFGTLVTMTDGAKKRPTGDNYSFMVSLNSAKKVTTVFNKLADGGQVTQPLEKQWWAALCGEVSDRFGVTWYVMTNS